MNPDLWIIPVFAALVGAVWKALKIIHWFKQRGTEDTNEDSSTAAPTTPDPEHLFISFLVVCGIAFGALLMLALTVHHKEPPSPLITLAVCLIGAVVVTGLLGLLLYKTVMDFSKRLEAVERQQVQKGSDPRQISFNRKPLKKAGKRQEDRVKIDPETRAKRRNSRKKE